VSDRFLCSKNILKMTKKDTQDPWFKPKPYLHLTNKLATQGSETKGFRAKRDNIIKNIKNPAWVAKHAFYPLLRYDIVERKYKKRVKTDGDDNTILLQRKDENGKLRAFRSHRVLKEGKWQSTQKVRGIEFPTHIDSQIFSYYKTILYEKYDARLKSDEELDKAVLAYRFIPQKENPEKGKNVAHFAKEVFDEIKTRSAKDGSCIALCFDIKGFFPSLCHNRILEVWKAIMEVPTNERLSDDHFAVYRAMTKFRYIAVADLKKRENYERDMANMRKNNVHAYFESPNAFREALKNGQIRVHKNDKEDKKQGIPHGLAISSTVANMYLMAFDEAVIETIVKEKGGFYRRYSDDIVVLCQESEIEIVKEFVMNEIDKIGLEIQNAKTDTFRFSQKEDICEVEKYVREQDIADDTKIRAYWKPNLPLVYLGFEFYGHKTLMKSAALAKFYRRMFDTLKRKAKRIKAHNKRHATEIEPDMRHIKRLYTKKGEKSQQVTKFRTIWEKDEFIDAFIPKKAEILPKKDENGKEIHDFRGNILAYAKRVGEIMKADDGENIIYKQFRNHLQQFNAAWERYKEREGL
jgi:hypothetical protein